MGELKSEVLGCEWKLLMDAYGLRVISIFSFALLTPFNFRKEEK